MGDIQLDVNRTKNIDTSHRHPFMHFHITVFTSILVELIRYMVFQFLYLIYLKTCN